LRANWSSTGITATANGVRIIRHERKRMTKLVATKHRVLVVRAEYHHVRMPMAKPGAAILICRPHVCSRVNGIVDVV
jgi:hypothetical protein